VKQKSESEDIDEWEGLEEDWEEFNRRDDEEESGKK
jgi:hypothetical protein